MKVQVDKIKPGNGEMVARRWLVFAREAFKNPALQAEFEAWKQAKQNTEYVPMKGGASDG